MSSIIVARRCLAGANGPQLGQVPRGVGAQEAVLAIPQAVSHLVSARERAAADHRRIRAGDLVCLFFLGALQTLVLILDC